MNWFKKIFIPSGEKVEITAYESWIVRWKSQKGEADGRWSPYTIDEAEVFTSYEDANSFAEQLKEAHKLLKITHGTKVTITKN